MNTPIVFIQGAGEGAYAADQKLADSLQRNLGEAYSVIYPRMPREDQPDYTAWKNQIAAELEALETAVILVGHSFGGSILLKYLAEEQPPLPISALLLIATPYWGAADWEVEEYALPQAFAAQLPDVPVYLYHGTDDEIVPFEHLACYAEHLPGAVKREVEGRDHQLNDDLSEVAADIQRLAANE